MSLVRDAPGHERSSGSATVKALADTAKTWAGSLVAIESSKRFLLLVSALVTLAVWAASYGTVQSDREHRLIQSAARAKELARLFEDSTLKLIGYADVYLREARRLYLRTGSLEAVEDFVARVPRDRSILSHITIIEPGGRPVYISGFPTRPDVTATDRPYFRYQKETPGDTIYISLPHRGRNTGRLTMRLVRRMETPDGAFAGVAFAAIDVAQITAFIPAVSLGDDTTATLVGMDRKIRARSSYGRLGPGQDISGSALWENLERSPVGLYTQTSVVDGIDRYYAYRKLADYPLVVAIGVANGDILKEAGIFARSVYTTAGLVTLMLMILTGATMRDGAIMRTLRREVSVRRRAERRALAANEAKSTFLATMSHEIRTPINAIMGLFELIERAEIPARQRAQARAGHTAAGQLLKQLNNVLDAPRIDADAMDITPRPEPVAPMLSDIRQWLEADIARSGKPIRASVTLADNVPGTVVMDRRRVDQVTINLIDNAVKFTAAGSITAAVDLAERAGVTCLRISVSDTGAGIAAGDRPRIFDRFAQLDRAMTRTAGGAGLGLSICREIAELLNGALEVESVKGRGSVFTLLPLSGDGARPQTGGSDVAD